MTGDYNDFGSFVGECELNLCFPDFLGKNEKIQLGSAGRFLQNLRITKFSGEIEIFFRKWLDAALWWRNWRLDMPLKILNFEK